MAKKKKSVLLLITTILTFATIAFNVFAMVSLLTNLFGFKDLYVSTLQKMSTYAIDIESEVSFAAFDLGLNALIYLLFGLRLLKYYVKGRTCVEMGNAITSMSVWFLILTFSLPAVMSLITGIVMTKKCQKPTTIAEATVVPNTNAPKNNKDISEYKMKAMTEAVTRLNELRSRGAISEEEYYANLDKILEG